MSRAHRALIEINVQEVERVPLKYGIGGKILARAQGSSLPRIAGVKRAGNIALAAFAVLDVVAAIYVIGNNHAPGKSAAVDALATVSATPTAGPRRTTLPHPARTTEASSAGPVVAFLGDDWTLGVGASATSRRFTTVVSRGLKLSERNFGLDGAGYAKSTGYRSRVDDVVAAKPAVVVVSGGRNDARGDTATAARQIHTLFADLHRRLPQAVLVALAPFWGDSDLPAELTVLGQAIKQAVTDVGGAYVGLADPIHGHPEFMADQADPNDDGYAAIAAAVEPELAKRLPR